MESIVADDYVVCYDAASNSVIFSGTLHLNGRDEYQPIIDFLEKAAVNTGHAVSWDFRELRELNSSGQGQLYRYVLKQLVKSGQSESAISLSIKGVVASAWQQKFLPNVKKILPGTRLYFS